ncbi:C40 family peptidase [Sporosarcina siberiensis]|uniref:C40 family peptidase n=1 Tax=Sporosarcina siberiensis TaxID=1365606 RepID=A0ABW4SEQ8_9BACL
MKKYLITSTLAIAIGFSSLGGAPSAIQPINASAATVTAQNNQQAVDAKADQITRFAKSIMGKATYGSNYSFTAPYQFKCASFMWFIFDENGVDLGSKTEDKMVKLGTHVPKSQLKKGDLVFFKQKTTGTDPDHMGMYIGDNKIIHMADSRQNIIISDLDGKSYYKDYYMTARRVLPSLLPSDTPKPTTPVKAPVASVTSADKVVDLASDLVGKAKFGYVYDEKTLTFTGAGFTHYIYGKQGVDLKFKLASRQAQLGKAVQKANLQKGDLLFFSTNNGGSKITQTGVFIGGNQYISLSTNGSVVKVSLDSAWSKKNYVTARRVL